MASRIGVPASCVGFWNWDFGSGLIQTCEQICEYFNLTVEEGRDGVTIDRLLEAVDPTDRSGLTDQMAECRKSGLDLEVAYRIKSQSLGYRALRTSGQCFRNRNGELAYFSGIVIDEERSRSERESLMATIELLLDAREAAETANRPLLVKLIDAVCLEAGRTLALAMDTDEKN